MGGEKSLNVELVTFDSFKFSTFGRGGQNVILINKRKMYTDSNQKPKNNNLNSIHFIQRWQICNTQR